jgi:TonB family protein
MKKNLFIFLSVVILSLTFVGASAAQSVKISKKEADKPVKILNKPRAQFGRCSQSSGQTKLRVTFDKSAKITDAVVVQSSGCDDFDKSALKAARGIKFKPAIKDGEAATVTKPVEYSFRIGY